MSDISIRVEKSDDTLQEPRWWAGQAVTTNKKGEATEVTLIGGNVYDEAVPKTLEHQIATIETYDPQTGESRFLPAETSVPRAGFETAAVNGTVYILGGSPSTKIEALKNGEISAAGELQTATSGARLAVTESDDLLIFGGYNKTPGAKGALASVEFFDTTAGGATTLLTPLTTPRAGHSLSRIGADTYLVAGGTGEAAGTAEIYSLQNRAGTTLPVAGMIFPRKDHNAVVDDDGKVWLIGGTGPDGKSVADIEVFDPVTRTFHVPTDSRTGLPMRLSVAREDAGGIELERFDAFVVAGGETKGITIGNTKDPYSNAIDVIDFRERTVYSLSNASEGAALIRDEAGLLVIRDSKRCAEIRLILGRGEDKKGAPMEDLILERR